MTKPPVSLFCGPPQTITDTDVIIGVAPNGEHYVFHHHTGESEYSDREDHELWITHWNRRDLRYQQIWYRSFPENEDDEWIEWNDDLNEVENGMYGGPEQRLEALTLWAEITANPYSFLLRALTLEVL